MQRSASPAQRWPAPAAELLRAGPHRQWRARPRPSASPKFFEEKARAAAAEAPADGGSSGGSSRAVDPPVKREHERLTGERAHVRPSSLPPLCPCALAGPPAAPSAARTCPRERACAAAFASGPWNSVGSAAGTHRPAPPRVMVRASLIDAGASSSGAWCVRQRVPLERAPMALLLRLGEGRWAGLDGRSVRRPNANLTPPVLPPNVLSVAGPVHHLRPKRARGPRHGVRWPMHSVLLVRHALRAVRGRRRLQASILIKRLVCCLVCPALPAVRLVQVRSRHVSRSRDVEARTRPHLAAFTPKRAPHWLLHRLRPQD